MLLATKNATAADVPATMREEAARIARPFTGHRPVIGVMQPPHSTRCFWAIRMQLTANPLTERLDDGTLFRGLELV